MNVLEIIKILCAEVIGAWSKTKKWAFKDKLSSLENNSLRLFQASDCIG